MTTWKSGIVAELTEVSRPQPFKAAHSPLLCSMINQGALAVWASDGSGGRCYEGEGAWHTHSQSQHGVQRVDNTSVQSDPAQPRNPA